MTERMSAAGRAQAEAERREAWKGWLCDWKTSGMSQAAFCRQHGLSPVQFSWWKRQLGGANARNSRNGFVAARIVEAPQLPDVRVAIALRGGRRLELSGGLDATLLRTLFEILETLP